MDNTLLKELIAQHKRVVIPDFGAFLRKDTEGSDELIFSPFLRKDDGVIVGLVAEKYGVDTEDARAMITEYVSHLRETLRASGRFVIDGIGTLTTDANGAISLARDTPAPAETSVSQPEPATARETSPAQQTAHESEDSSKSESAPFSNLPPVADGFPPAITRPRSIQVQEGGDSTPPASTPAAEQTPPPAAPATPPPVFRQPGAASPRPGQPMAPQAGRPFTPPTYPYGSGRPTPPPSSGNPAGTPPPASGRPARTPNQRPHTKTDVWLIISIIAALVVIGIMIYGFVSTEPAIIDMEQVTPVEVVDSL